MITLFLALVFVHFLLDYPLQGDFLSRAKNKTNPIPGVPWYQAMFAHTFMHAAGVWLITGMWSLALIEFVVHWWTDDQKCRGELTFNQDQAIHILCKVFYVLVIAYFMVTTGNVGDSDNVWMV